MSQIPAPLNDDQGLDHCDSDEVGAWIPDDLEFVHDKGGVVARSGAEFLARIRASCVAQAEGREPRTRRERIECTLEVFPISNIGAVETGTHRFYHLHPGKPDEPTEEGRFTMYWRREGSQWRLARVLSYDHSPVRFRSFE